MYILNSQFCSKLILQNCSRIILEWTKFFSSTTVKVNMGPAFILSVYKNLRRLFCVNYLFLFFFNSSLILFLFAFQTFNIVQYSGTNIFYMAQEIHFFWHKGPFSLKRKMFVLFSFWDRVLCTLGCPKFLKYRYTYINIIALIKLFSINSY